MYLDEYFCNIPFLDGRAFNHTIMNYIRWIVIFDSRQEYGNVLMITIPCYFTDLIILSAYPKWSHVAAIFTSTCTNKYINLLNSMPISITHITRTTLPYNFNTPIKILLRSPSVWLGMCLTVTNLSFLDDVIMNEFPLTNIISDASVTNLCSL